MNVPAKYVMLASALAFAGGCQTYQPLEISHTDALLTVNSLYEQHRAELENQQFPDFGYYASLMSNNNPELQQLKEEYRAAEEIAGIGTPWPNPSLEFGQARGYNLEEAAANKVQPFVGLGFTVPLGGRIGKEDDVNAAVSEQKRVSLLTQHRSLYMQLRKSYLSYLLAKQELEVGDSIIATVQSLERSSRNLAKIGTAGRLDVLDTSFDLKEIELTLLDARKQYIDLAQEFAALVGTSTQNVNRVAGEIPDISAITLPDTENQLRLIGENNRTLVERKAEFTVADAQLKLELAKQYPDISFGGEGEKEPGEKSKILTLSIGIDLPLFDRNQQAIADAKSTRAVIARQYQGDLQTLLTQLDRLTSSFENIKQQISALNELVTISDNRLTTARQSLRAGSLDMTNFLDMQKEHDLLLIEEVEKRREFWETIFELEDTLGIPLVTLSGESFKQDIFNVGNNETAQEVGVSTELGDK